MTRESLEGLIESGHTVRSIAHQLDTSYTNVRYWLKKHGLKTKRGPSGSVDRALREFLDSSVRCPNCGEKDVSKFYGRRRDVCGSCHNDASVARTRRKREMIVRVLGGKCTKCGFDKYRASLDAHHADPSKKDPSARHMRFWSDKRIMIEIAKCVLLCKNCHAALHSGELTISS